VVYAWRQYDPVRLFEADSNPLICLRPNVKIAIALKDISDLLVLMQVLIKEHLDLVFVHVTHSLWRDSNHIPILVVALCRQLVNPFDFWVVKIKHAQFRKLVHRNLAARVMDLSLVALETVGHKMAGEWIIEMDIPACYRTSKLSS
jgi:hypothetical protein